MLANLKDLKTARGKAIVPLIALGAALVLVGCESRAGSTVFGGAVGVGAAAGGYELHLKRQMTRIAEDLANGTISQEEYAIRKDQIERDSLVR